MGFLPMFAADPYSAKQFKGIYNIRYHDVAFFYRTSKQLIQLLMPFLIISFFDKKSKNILLLIVIGVILIAVSLSRSEAVTGLILIFSIIIALKKSKKVFIYYLLSLIFVYSLGSSFWIIASVYFPKAGYVHEIDNLSIGYAIASGAPDIPDQLSFLEAFNSNHIDFTYGLTFVGGLIPFNFKWNPSVWTLLVVNDTDDISEIASGGLRLPVSLWGYVSFGWLGVIVVPFFSAFLIGYITKKIKSIVNKLPADANGYLIFYWLVFLYLNIGIVFTSFYTLSIYFLPGFVFYAMVNYFIKKTNPKRLPLTR
ncbi:O-antigen polymerase [Pedobacter mendelii]